MSRTYRFRSTSRKPGGRKMKPYTKNNKVKYETPSYEEGFRNGNYGGPTKEMKEEIRNANRSLKKGIRQELKRELISELEALDYGK